MLAPDLDAVIGAGFNGLYQLWRLREQGFSVRLVEASPGLGGVWQANRYPGARVDSHVPNYEFSIEPVWRDWTWKERFPSRDELVAYFDHVDEVLGLRPDVDLDTRVTAAHYRPDDRRWTVTASTRADDGEISAVTYDCRFLVPCTGFGSAPYVPDIPGLADFAGEAHHTADVARSRPVLRRQAGRRDRHRRQRRPGRAGGGRGRRPRHRVPTDAGDGHPMGSANSMPTSRTAAKRRATPSCSAAATRRPGACHDIGRST